jgi:hypothetical protein
VAPEAATTVNPEVEAVVVSEEVVTTSKTNK